MSRLDRKLDTLLEEFGNGVAIFLDQDETMLWNTTASMYAIIAGRHGAGGSHEEIVKAAGGIMFPKGLFDPRVYQSYDCVFPRPGLETFLEECLAITPDLFVCTSGGTEFQSKILELIGVRKYFKGVYGRDSELPGPYRLKILVDDLSEHTTGIVDKLERLGDAVHIQAPRWVGPTNNEGDLSEVLIKIKEVVSGNLTSISLRSALYRLRGSMAAGAQKIYDEWDGNGGGICDQVAQAIAAVVAENIPNAEIDDWGHDGDDHAAVMVKRGDIKYKVDIPARLYETGSGYNWQKKPGIKFGPDFVDVELY